MPITTAEIREVQAGLAARNPSFPAPGSYLDTIQPEPSDPTDGQGVQTAVGANAVYTLLVVEAEPDITYDFVWWGYSSVLNIWGKLDGGSRTGQVDTWMQLVPTGPIDRLYFQLTSIVISGAGVGVRPRVGPCDPGAI